MKQILIVEDELLLAMVNRQIVEHAGFSVLDSLTKGEDAVERVKKHNPDLILMDIYLAGTMDGVTAVEEIRNFSDTPVIFVSGNSDKATRARAEAIPNTKFIVKPVKAEVLRDEIRANLRG